MTKFLVVNLILAAILPAQERRVSPVAGPSSRGDGGPATAALLDGPQAVAVDRNGDTYFTETQAGVIRRVRQSDGMVERVAGTGVRLDGPEGRQASETDLITPSALHVHSVSGELYIADSKACRIRRILADSTVRNVAGTGRCAGGGGGFPFPGGVSRERLALDTDLGAVSSLTTDSDGRLLFAEENLHQVRRIDADGFVRTVAGTGSGSFSGDGGLATDASLNSPTGLVFDSRSNLYIADSRNCRVRRVDSGGYIDTVAGTNTCAARSTSFSGGSTLRTALGRLAGLGYDASAHVLYAASPQQSRLLRIDLDGGRVTSVLGNGTVGVPDFSRFANQFVLSEPGGVAVRADSSVLVTAPTAYQIYRLSEGEVRAFAGRWPDESTLLRPVSTCTHADGSLLVLDAGTERVLRLDALTGQMTVFAGAPSPTGYTSGDGGVATRAQLADPRRLLCAESGLVYLSHGSQLRVIETTGVIRSLRANLGAPTGLALDPDGRLIYADAENHRVYRYEAGSRTDTVLAGTGRAGFSGDGAAAVNAQLDSPGDLSLDAAGNLLIADRNNRRIRRLRANDGRIETIIGSQREFSFIDLTGELANDVGLDPIRGLTATRDGTIYVAEPSRLIAVDIGGRVSVLLGYAGEDDAGVKSYRLRAVGDLSGLGPAGAGVLAAVGSEGVVLRVE
ncbi:MAG: hypothetical protein K2X03_16090 [Bryobacteraceae bacterium]|nr:hypothetical protein [Bryobacteraceae bacterium]